MGKNKLKIPFFTLILFAVLQNCVHGQQLGIYNLEHLPQRSSYNPSFMPLGKLNVGIPLFSGFGYNYSNNGFSYADVVHKTSNDSLVIDTKGAIAGLNNRNCMRISFETELLSIGFRTGRNYISFNATEKVNFNFTYSKALIEFLYYGNAATMGTEQILNPGIEAIHYREYGLTWAREISNKLKGGVKLKYLYGMENIKTSGNGVSMYTDPTDFSITAKSDLMVQTSGLDSTSFGDAGFGGYAFGKKNTGIGIDAGFTYKPVQQIELSGAILDFGSIRWSSNVSTYSTSTKSGSFTYSGINLNEFVNNDTTSAEEYLNNMADSLYSTFDIKTTHDSYKYKMPLQFYLSGSYLITPRYRFSVLLRNKKINSENQIDYQISFTGKSKTWFNYTVGLNKINKSKSTLGAGFTLNFHNDQVYFVSDNIPGLFSWKKSYNTGFKAGLNIMFGTRPKYMKPPQPVQTASTK